MSEKENKDNMLSFDKLREGLGIEGELPKLKTDIIVEESMTHPQKSVKQPVAEGKSVVENGKTFIDITDQYSFYEVNPVTDVEIISVPEDLKETPAVPKKRLKTFNELITDFLKQFIPVRDDSSKEKIRKVAMDISIVLIICCIIGIIGSIDEFRQTSVNSGNLSGQTAAVDKLEDNKYAEGWKNAYAQSSGTGYPTGMNSKYAYLYYKNQDLVGWLSIDNTNLDVQIVQSKDNEYYLTKDFYKNSSQYGCPYLDYRNVAQGLDDNTIIYGPYMANGLMFKALDQYKTVEGYRNAPLIEYSTLYKTYTFKVFAAYELKGNDAADNSFNYAITDFISDAKFLEFINEVKSRSIFTTDVSVQTDDKILTLVTTVDDGSGDKLVVMGRLVRENESTDVDVSGAKANNA